MTEPEISDQDETEPSEDLPDDEQNSQQPETDSSSIEHFKAEANKNGREAKSLRTRLRSTEADLAASKSRVEAYEKAEVLAAVKPQLHTPEDVFLVRQLDDFRSDDG